MNDLIDKIFLGLENSGLDVRIIIAVIALLPIAEARIAIPMAIKCGLSPFEAFIFGFAGSSVCVPVLLVALIPLIKRLAKSKWLNKIGVGLMSRINSKATKIDKTSTAKKFFGTALFVAVPLPLTGVWTGSAVASVLELGYFKALAAVILGNFVASLIITIITATLNEYIDIIMAAFALIALVAVLTMLIKVFKPKKSA